MRTLDAAVKSGNNGVRIPAINAVMQAVGNASGDVVFQAALDSMVLPLESSVAIGGMEVRMMAVAAVERIGTRATSVGAKAKAMGLMQSYAARSGWEPEAQRRAKAAAAAPSPSSSLPS